MRVDGTSGRFVIAVDAGGTYTRVGCFDLRGDLLSTATGRGGSPEHNDYAAQNIADALRDALESGGLDRADAVGLGAGVAGIKRRGSHEGHRSNEWAEQFFADPLPSCPRRIVNDAVSAHRGALLGAAGIIVVAGTGSMILAVTDRGVEIESGQFEHYGGGARHLAHHAIQLILAEMTAPDDAALVNRVLDYWRVENVSELREAVLEMGADDPHRTNRHYGGMAPLITAAADDSPLADRSLRALVDRTALGVAVLAPLVGADPVPVVTAGALATDPRFGARLVDALAQNSGIPAHVAAPALDPLGGAALLAFDAAGVAASASLIERLRSSQE